MYGKPERTEAFTLSAVKSFLNNMKTTLSQGHTSRDRREHTTQNILVICPLMLSVHSGVNMWRLGLKPVVCLTSTSSSLWTCSFFFYDYSRCSAAPVRATCRSPCSRHALVENHQDAWTQPEVIYLS